jgi:hypothetical protein
VLFHSGTCQIADGSIPTNNEKIPIARALYGVNHASEQALAHLSARHDVLLAMTIHEPGQSFEPLPGKERTLVWNPSSKFTNLYGNLDGFR